MANTNENQHRARADKNDEFYTQLSDIENELRHYKHHFENKVVICNCDDPYESNFVKYFILNFKILKLKKLIATCFDGSPISTQEFVPNSLFGDAFKVDCNTPRSIQTLVSKAYKIEITDVVDYNNDGAIDLEDAKILLNKPGVVTALKGNGDFRSEECLALLDEADICVTNPPFSLIEEFITTLITHKKHFLILGQLGHASYKTLFPLLQENKIWLGHNSRAMEFIVPKTADRKNIYIDEETGQYKAKFGNIAWYTNLDNARRHEELVMYKDYILDGGVFYDNYDAINIDLVSEIPFNYFGVMGVPISFLDKHNPEQFVILGLAQKYGMGLQRNKLYNDYLEYDELNKQTGSTGVKINGNPIIKGKPKNKKKYKYFMNNKGDIVQSLYSRIFIKRKYKDDGTLNIEENN